MSDKFKPWTGRKPKNKNKSFQNDDRYRGRKGKDRNTQERFAHKDLIKCH